MLLHTTSIAATEAAQHRRLAHGHDVRLQAIDELAAVGIVDASVQIEPAEINDSTEQVTVNLWCWSVCGMGSRSRECSSAAASSNA